MVNQKTPVEIKSNKKKENTTSTPKKKIENPKKASEHFKVRWK